MSPRWAVAAVGFLAVSIVVGVLAGPLDIGAGEAFRSLLARLGLADTTPLDPTAETILWELRVPRVVLAALVGGMLAIAGATYQGVFHNPLADPYLLGVAAGAGLGATLAISYLPRALADQQLLPIAAFVGGAAAVVVTWTIGRSAGRERDATTFVLSGVVVASFFTAVQTFVQQQNSDTLQEVYSWILGALPSSGWSDVAVLAPYVLVATVVILAYRRVLDVLSLGDTEAASLGVDVGRVRLLLVVAATVGTAAAVAVSGLIAFVGIIVPAHDPAARRDELSRAAAALVRRRRRVPRFGRRDRADGAVAGGAANRCRHRVLRRRRSSRSPSARCGVGCERDLRPRGHGQARRSCGG